MTRWATALLLAASWSTATAAEPLRPPGIGTADPRQAVDVREAPWHALGRVQRGGSLCTGALVAPRTVLTAAHCLVGRNTRGLVEPEAVHFLLGYHMGRWRAEARVIRFVVGPGFDPARRRPGPEWADWALLTLDRPLATPDQVLPLMAKAPAPRSALMIAGYQQDRREVLLADTGCRLVGVAEVAPGRQMLVHDCAATRGASGAPVLARGPDGQGWAVAGLLVSVARDMALGFAVPAAALPAPE
ncbi:trypsin-like serine peptidase [Falsiroseomonas oryzae]|uniref:trypsin-like serine peptidase n=1 Tax=Falsiroseomonas oryzae TaxID=2766473 RepID=UPI0022EB1182|nr:trypsin-like serine protease [Roseomonas sp. MO-31]